MGLDIHINTDKDEELFPSDYFGEGRLSRQHSLSRTFCNFMSARQIDRKQDFESIREITISIVNVGYLLNKDPTLLLPLKGQLDAVCERSEKHKPWDLVEGWNPEGD